ncbi:xanthine dehydrogenase family protein subunit M [Hymenobacter sp. NST-14]|uniref:FAD binding domain-containing protein n=1 Tax=Hymenobacter piscis TaxID=2839984 RepID=UPI001C00E441|nr:xanthine dehydrogenase family protein subunit M [Hymenobacter piscis]MBT9392781.1 xanthine dehydrogenase family protein subunit M [Hymenobacter piscis]
MNNFSYYQADKAKDATSAKRADKSAAFIAGGTTLLDLMKLNVENHDQLIDVNTLPFRGVEMTKNGLRIGALERMSDVGEHPLVVKNFPAVSQSLLLAASAQLRNMASIGGNILQRTRCGYFRDTAFPCNKREPGTGCPALEGDHRNLAILGTSEACIATSYPGDLSVALTALDAVLTLENAKGKQREVPITRFYLLPGSTPQKETVLEDDELLVAVTIPQTVAAQKSLYLKVRERTSYAYALASAAVGLEVQGGIIRAAKVALGGVGTQPWRSPEAEKMLVGKAPSEAVFRAAAEAALRGAKPREHNAFKVEMAQNTLVRALSEVAA